VDWPTEIQEAETIEAFAALGVRPGTAARTTRRSHD
jgi:hypothetical protein